MPRTLTMQQGTRVRRAARRAGRRLRQTAAALARGALAAAARLTYRRQELAVLGLLAASVLGGFAVEAWRRRAPGVLERLEAEPPRLVPPARARPGPRAGAPPRTWRAASTPERGPGSSTRAPIAPGPDRPLDLNRATADELARLPGVGGRLAARILARRAALGGRFASADDLAAVPGLGGRKAAGLRPLVTAGAEGPP